MKKNLIFIGLSHLSLNYAAVSAQKLNKVYIFDFKKKIYDYKAGNIHFYEPKLKKILDENKNKITFTSTIKNINKNNIFFIAIDIKTNKKNQSDYQYINKLLSFLTLNCLDKKQPLIIMSQVYPNFTRKINWPKKNLYYQVETLIFGKAIKRAEKPERIIIGTNDGKEKINKDYNTYLDSFHCPLVFMKYEEAELTKMYINAYLVSDVILTNLLSSISKKLNLNWLKSVEALKLDKRIGKHAYLMPGLGISGGNLERDIINLSVISKKLKLDNTIFNNYLKASKIRKNWISTQITENKRKKIITDNSTIGIIGLAYKQGTNSIKNSPSMLILRKLIKRNKLLFFDEKINTHYDFKTHIVDFVNINKLIQTANTIFIMHNYNKLKKYNFNMSNITLIIDPYNVLNNFKFNKNIKYVTL